jgi:hypothetical protein
MKKLLIFSMAFVSMASFANGNQDNCKAQASAAVDAIKLLATTHMGVTDQQKEKATTRAKALDELMAKGLYCDALQMATASE